MTQQAYTTTKFTNVAMKKTKSYMNLLNLHKYVVFLHQTMSTNHFLQTMQYTEKKLAEKNTQKLSHVLLLLPILHY